MITIGDGIKFDIVGIAVILMLIVQLVDKVDFLCWAVRKEKLFGRFLIDGEEFGLLNASTKPALSKKSGY